MKFKQSDLKAGSTPAEVYLQLASSFSGVDAMQWTTLQGMFSEEQDKWVHRAQSEWHHGTGGRAGDSLFSAGITRMPTC